MAWPKGRHRPKSPTAGRKSGVTPPRLSSVGEHARELLDDPSVWEDWRQQLAARTIPMPLLLRLMDYAWGRPVETVNQTGPPAVLQIIQTRRPASAPAVEANASPDADGSPETKSRAPRVSLVGQRNIITRKEA